MNIDKNNSHVFPKLSKLKRFAKIASNHITFNSVNTCLILTILCECFVCFFSLHLVFITLRSFEFICLTTRARASNKTTYIFVLSCHETVISSIDPSHRVVLTQSSVVVAYTSTCGPPSRASHYPRWATPANDRRAVRIRFENASDRLIREIVRQLSLQIVSTLETCRETSERGTKGTSRWEAGARLFECTTDSTCSGTYLFSRPLPWTSRRTHTISRCAAESFHLGDVCGEESLKKILVIWVNAERVLRKTHFVGEREQPVD